MDRPICPKCGEPMTVTTSRDQTDFRLQYYGCRGCRCHTGGAPRLITKTVGMSSSRTNRETKSCPPKARR